MAEKLRLKVVTPTRVVVDTLVDEVQLPGMLGVLGILPGHAPLVASLSIGELMYRHGLRESYLAIQWGFAEVGPDSVTVLAEVAERPEEIDVQAAQEARRRAEEALRLASGEEFAHHKTLLEAAVTRLKVAARR
ncbi:MAG: F0F1 ATP synthase subunit epsilon [Thermoanaerobaculum sp.]|nr:F0F1 ATP synthase subunit epsilon [Thermoanaerobaculum sp.]